MTPRATVTDWAQKVIQRTARRSDRGAPAVEAARLSRRAGGLEEPAVDQGM